MVQDFNQYTVKDIQEFLLKKGITCTDSFVKNSNNSISTNGRLINSKGEADVDLYIFVDEISFRCQITVFSTRSTAETISKDFSQDWVKYLISKDPTRTSRMKVVLVGNIKLTHENANKKIELLEKQINDIKRSEEADCSYWGKMLKMVDKAINSSSQKVFDDKQSK